MEENDYDEIISTLAKCGRPDLIASFQKMYQSFVCSSPSASSSEEDTPRPKHGKAVYEELEVVISPEGFYSLA